MAYVDKRNVQESINSRWFSLNLVVCSLVEFLEENDFIQLKLGLNSNFI